MEELSYSEVDSVPCKLENNQQLTFEKMIRRSSEREDESSRIINDTRSVSKLISDELEVRRNDDSGIEMTPRKNGDQLRRDEEPEDSEILQKIKLLSCSQIVVDNLTINGLRTIH